MLKIIPFAHQLIKEVITAGDIAIDATCGNGFDTLLLSKLVGDSGHVYACDIQEKAILNTKQLLNQTEHSNVSYILDSHSNIDKYLGETMFSKVSAIIFNLGYLPKGDKSIITKPKSTIAAIQKMLPLLDKGGRLVLVIYHGHDGGVIEKQAILDTVQGLNQTKFEVALYQFINQKNNPPFVIAVEKK